MLQLSAQPTEATLPTTPRLSHLRLLEAESIHILREVAAELRSR